MNAVRAWFAARSQREKRLLVLMAAVALPTLAWLFVIPLQAAYESALQEQLEAVDRNGRVRALAEGARARPAAERQPQAAADLALVVTESAAQAGIPLEIHSPAGPNAVTVQVGNANATAVIQWLGDLETRGISVEELRMTPSADRTVAMSARLRRLT